MTISPARYSTVAITLHWLMALAFILMLASGLAMDSDGLLPPALKFQMFQWHKSLGVCLLMLFFVRLGWRLLHEPPALPASIKGLEKLAAHAGHWGLYALMIAMPLTGWLMVSASVFGLPTIVFGLFEWPHIPGVAMNEAISGAANQAHGLLAWVFIALIAGHIAAVIKHAVIDKHNLLPRMGIGKAE